MPLKISNFNRMKPAWKLFIPPGKDVFYVRSLSYCLNLKIQTNEKIES